MFPPPGHEPECPWNSNGDLVTHLLALTGVLIISFSAVFVRLADASPATAAFYRTAYALPALLLAWWLVRRADHRAISNRYKALLAGLLLAADFALWHRSIGLIGAGLATVLGNTQVLFVAVAAWAMHRERPTRLALAVLPVTFAGLMLLSGLGSTSAYGRDPMLGVLLGVATGLTYAGFLLLLRSANPDKVPSAGPLLDLTLGATLGSVVLGLLDGQLSLGMAWPQHGWLLALALGPQVLGWLLISHALPRLPALETSVLLLGQPLATLVWAALIFGEHLSNLQGLGVVLVLGGVTVLSVRGSVQTADVKQGKTRERHEWTTESR